jgi:tRNA isopentenyl-2-thiomethyl-A-37 hydroxylase MiaE
MKIKKLIKNKTPFIVMKYAIKMQASTLIHCNWCVCSIKPEIEINRIIKVCENQKRKPNKELFVKTSDISKENYAFFRENLHLFNKKNVPDGTIYEPKGIETLKERVQQWI